MDPYVQLHQDATSSSGDRRQHPKYRGVRKRKWGKWVSEIRLPNSRERVWLGSYDTPEKAARAFDAAQYCLRGRNAQFNFPDSPPDIPVTPCLSPREIQAIAARFANDREDGEGLIAARTDAAEGALYEAGAAGSSECGNMGWPFLDKWFDDDTIYGGMGYMGSSDLQCSDIGLLHRLRIIRTAATKIATCTAHHSSGTSEFLGFILPRTTIT